MTQCKRTARTTSPESGAELERRAVEVVGQSVRHEREIQALWLGLRQQVSHAKQLWQHNCCMGMAIGAVLATRIAIMQATFVRWVSLYRLMVLMHVGTDHVLHHVHGVRFSCWRGRHSGRRAATRHRSTTPLQRQKNHEKNQHESAHLLILTPPLRHCKAALLP